MTKSAKYRSLASLAVLHLSESDLRSLHAMIHEMSLGSFLEMIRDIEDKLDHSMSLILDRETERASIGSGATELYSEIDHIRRTELRVAVQRFAGMLSESLSRISRDQDVEIPRFEPRRGLEAWISKLIRAFSEQDVYHAAMQVRLKGPDRRGSDWKLR